MKDQTRDQKDDPQVDEQELKTYQLGEFLIHRRFGKGKILEKNGEVVNVRFEKVGDKKMNLAVCLVNGVITRERKRCDGDV